MSIAEGSYWCSDLNERLKISSLTLRQKKRIQQELAKSVPSKHRPWPYGMPTSVNPYLVLLGISPGGLGKNRERADYSDYDYTPSVGEAHKYFDLEDEWASSHWQKARKLCLTILKQRDRKLSPEECMSLSGHLNLGTWQIGNGSDPSAVDPEIAKWVPSLLAEKLKPDVLILLGLNGMLRKLRSSWKASSLSFLLQKPELLLPFEYPGKRSYCFKLWRNPDSSAAPRLVIAMPNHPSRHPFGNPLVWENACRQVSKIVQSH